MNTIETTPKLGIVYILLSNGYHKIGCTKRSLSDRLKAFSTGNPMSITCLHYIVCKKYPCNKIEKYLHEMSFGYRITNNSGQKEWFKLDEEYLEWLKSVKCDLDLFKE